MHIQFDLHPLVFFDLWKHRHRVAADTGAFDDRLGSGQGILEEKRIDTLRLAETEWDASSGIVFSCQATFQNGRKTGIMVIKKE